MSHDDVAELLGAYALDALDEDEAALVEAHVATCPRCAAELDEHREVAGLLGNAGGEAPRELWDRIATQATRPLRDPGDGAAPRPLDAVAGPPALGADRRDAPTRRHRRRARVVAASLATAAAVTIALLAVQVGRLDTRVDRLAGAAQRRGLAAAEQAALLDPATRVVALGAPTSPGATVAELVLARGGQSFFVNRGLGPLPVTETYQLWGVSGTTRVSLGLLGRRPDLVVVAAGPARRGTVYAVTVERAAGAVAPTSSPIAVSTS